MSSKIPPWLDDSPAPVPVTLLSQDELIDLWSEHRNDILGFMAAEEVVRRLAAERPKNKMS
jgi:hypothetical protein